MSCYACHPQLFDAQRRPVTHRVMQQGLACGACHDGALAPAVKKMDCRSCHVR